MKPKFSPAALIGIMVVLVAAIAVFAWRVLFPPPSGPGPDMTHWNPNNQPPAVKAYLNGVQARGGKVPPP
ncbi:MAG TPA: hypothetical protein VFJ58_03790 [Armatimonadota bacterium]|nr:hypothetical protein [Armatimonadota bacterium]